MDRPDPDKERMQLVLEAYERSRKTYGYRRIQIWIEREYGIKINHKAVLRLMRKLNIRSVARKRNPYRLSNNRYGAIHTYPNLMNQNFKTNGPNQKWGTDITYIPTQQGFVYLAVIKDFYDAVRVVDDYIHFYNHDRIQLKTKLTPLEFRRQFV